jgi:hypothetical protein
LIDSSPRTPFARQFLKIIFACADVASARAVDAKLHVCARKIFVARRQQQDTVNAISPYFIGLFAVQKICIRNA